MKLHDVVCDDADGNGCGLSTGRYTAAEAADMAWNTGKKPVSSGRRTDPASPDGSASSDRSGDRASPDFQAYIALVRRERTLELLLRDAAEWLAHVDARYEDMNILKGLRARIEEALEPGTTPPA